MAALKKKIAASLEAALGGRAIGERQLGVIATRST